MELSLIQEPLDEIMSTDVAALLRPLIPFLQFDIQKDVLDPIVVIDVDQDSGSIAVLGDEDRLFL